MLSLPSACAALFVLSVSACGGGGSNDGASSSGTSGGTSADDSGASSSSGSSGASSSGASSSGSSSSGGGGVDAGPPGVPAPARCTAAPAEYEGVDTSKVPAGTPPAGCVAGYNLSTRVMTLTMDASSAMEISAKNGEVTVNGVACTATNGAPAKVAEAKSIVIQGSAGDDTLIVDLSGGPLSALDIDLKGGTDAFVIAGSPGPDVINAGAAKAGTAFDWTGDLTTDAVVLGAENFTVSMGAGDDAFHASGAKSLGDSAAVAFTTYGGAGNDTLEGGTMSDALCGGAGNDTFLATTMGADQYEGGDGVDLASFATRTNALTITLDDVANDGEKNEAADVRASVENVTGGSGDDILVGNVADNTLVGGAGNDSFLGGAGNDTMSGGIGDDTFDEEAAMNGSDLLDGADGNDIVIYARRTANLTISLCANTTPTGCPANSGEAGESDTLVNMENASGGAGDDTFNGNGSSNSFYGGAGNDTMEGNDGDDYLYGDDGADILHGGNGDDYLDGARQFDMFNGGPGQGDICIVETGESPTACELY